ncbi:MAG: hypothetical protein ACE5KU_04280 [Nitrososphaerales archaeon]
MSGRKSNYHKPSLEHLEKEYLKAVPFLTVSEVEEVRREADERLKLKEERIKVGAYVSSATG